MAFLEEGENTLGGQAIEFFEQALAIDPNYAEAYAGIALAYSGLGQVGGSIVFARLKFFRRLGRLP